MNIPVNQPLTREEWDTLLSLLGDAVADHVEGARLRRAANEISEPEYRWHVVHGQHLLLIRDKLRTMRPSARFPTEIRPSDEPFLADPKRKDSIL